MWPRKHILTELLANILHLSLFPSSLIDVYLLHNKSKGTFPFDFGIGFGQ